MQVLGFRRVVVVAASLCLLSHVGVADAESEASGQSNPGLHEAEASGVEEARAVYEEAARAYEKRRYEDAIDLFLQADRLSPNPAFDFNIGLAYEDMGDVARALHYYRSYLRRDPEASDRDDVDGRIRRLERKLGDKGIQQVTILSEPDGARFSVDGEPVGVTPWTGEIAPGFHELTLDLRGYRVERRSFDLPHGRAIDVPVTLTKLPPKRRGSSAPAGEAARCQGACLDAISTSSWVIGGVGAASLIGALAFELDRQGLEEAAEREPAQAEASRLFDEALESQRWATALGLMGGAMFVSGGILALYDIRDARREDDAAAARVPVVAGCSRSGCSFVWTQSF